MRSGLEDRAGALRDSLLEAARVRVVVDSRHEKADEDEHERVTRGVAASQAAAAAMPVMQDRANQTRNGGRSADRGTSFRAETEWMGRTPHELSVKPQTAAAV